MAYNREIEHKIDGVVLEKVLLIKRKMFGGVCYLLNGNISFGIYKEYMIVRVGDEERADNLIDNKDILPFDITGKKMKGWIMVHNRLLNSEEEIERWARMGLDFAATLPGK